MVRTIQFESRPHPDAYRIAGFSAAIAFNALLVLMLLVPLSAPMPLPDPPVIEPIRWILPKVDPPKPPIPVPVIRPRAVTPVRAVTPPAVEQVVVDQGNQQADPVVQAPVATVIHMPAASGPLPGVRLEYADAPAPAYPRDALHDGIEGTVVLRVLVDTDGRPLDVQIHQTSGHRQLDDAARRHVLKRWTFHPAMQDGLARQAIGLVPIAFDLDR